MVTSIMDYLGRWLALKFLPKEQAMQFHNKELVQKAYEEGTKSKDAFAMRLPILDEGATVQIEDRGTIVEEKTSAEIEEQIMEVEAAPTKMEIAKLQGFTGSICTGCGSVRVKRNGSCEVCLDCGATSGCS
jgi:ribonucleoside-diphosphate reductase alpha chain